MRRSRAYHNDFPHAVNSQSQAPEMEKDALRCLGVLMTDFHLLQLVNLQEEMCAHDMHRTDFAIQLTSRFYKQPILNLKSLHTHDFAKNSQRPLDKPGRTALASRGRPFPKRFHQEESSTGC